MINIQGIFSLQVEECFVIKNRGVVVSGAYTGDIRVGTILYDSDNNSYVVRGIEMPHYYSFVKIENRNNLGILIYSDTLDSNYLKFFLQGKQLKSEQTTV